MSLAYHAQAMMNDLNSESRRRIDEPAEKKMVEYMKALDDTGNEFKMPVIGSCLYGGVYAEWWTEDFSKSMQLIVTRYGDVSSIKTMNSRGQYIDTENLIRNPTAQQLFARYMSMIEGEPDRTIGPEEAKMFVEQPDDPEARELFKKELQETLNRMTKDKKGYACFD